MKSFCVKKLFQAVEVTKFLKFKFVSLGCEWGSKYVELYFEEFLKEFFGPELF